MTATVETESAELASLKARLAEAEETLRAISHGEVDALVVNGDKGDQVFALKGAETPYRLLVEAINEGAVSLALDGTILYCNKRFVELLNRPMEHVIASSCHRFMSFSEQARFQTFLHNAALGGKGEFSLERGDGSMLPVELSVHTLKLEEIAAISMVVTDITERKKSEEALRKANEELELRVQQRTAELTSANATLSKELLERRRVEKELNMAQEQLETQARGLEREVLERTAHLNASIRSLETLCYNMAHDLRAPNRSMQGFAELLLVNYMDRLDATGQDYLRRIAAAAERNDALILDMLAYGRIAHAAMPCSRQNLKPIIHSVLEKLAPDIKARNGSIRVSEPLPSVWANRNVLEQALTNLISNALKFVPSEVAPEVQIWAEAKAPDVRLLIKDNGIGIDPDLRPRVFKVFERLAPAKSYPGTGMGLAIVQKAVERMGGRTDFESEPGQGSCFWIELRADEPEG